MRPRPALALLSAAVLLTACGPAKDLKLSLRAVSIDVPRVVTPAVVLVPAPPVPPPVSLPPLPPVQLPPPAAPVPSAPPVVVPPPACPKAGPFDVGDVPATPSVAHAPAPDTFPQQSQGTFSSPAGSGTFAGELTAKITSLGTETSSVGQQLESWRVERKDATGTATSVETYRLVKPSSNPAATTPGVYLVGLAWSDPLRGKLVFNATGNGVIVLPVPVAVATNDTQYAGAATDPDTLTTVAIVRNVRGHKKVDACGKVIDTITSEMTGTIVSRDLQLQLSWTQQWATGYGAFVAEQSLTVISQLDGLAVTQVVRSTGLPKEVA